MLCFAMAALAFGSARGQTLPGFTVVGDAIPASLTGTSGDATRGRALVVDRGSTCILCHSGPFLEQKFQGKFGTHQYAQAPADTIAAERKLYKAYQDYFGVASEV